MWQLITSSILTFDRARIEPAAALRCTLGVAVPLAMALALDQPRAATFIAVGAVSVGFGSFQGTYRSRAATMLLASLAMAWSIFVGSLTGDSNLLAIVIAALWSFSAGLLVAFGPAAAFVGLQSTVAVLIADAFPTDVQEAAIRAATVFAGGLVQTLFVVVIWPFRRFDQERRTIAELYRGLADYARGIADGARRRVPESAIAPALASIQSDPHPFARQGETLVFQALLDEGDRLRVSLAALSFARDTAAAREVAPLLDEIANAVQLGREPDDVDGRWRTLESLDTQDASLSPTVLLARLRAAWRTAQAPITAEGHVDGARGIEPLRPFPPLRDAWTTIRANLTLRSTVCRHGLRLAAAVTTATAVYRLGHIPRGYWISMTALIVLKPEFHETLVTGSARIAGTLIGALLGTLLAVALGTHHATLAALLLLFVWGGYTLFRANYTAFTISFTGYVVLLLTLSGVAGPEAAVYRAIDTLIGGLLGLVIYTAWPTWESGRARESLATLLEALSDDAKVLIGAYVDPSTWQPEALQRSRHAARLARSNAEASVDRMLAEPERSRLIDAQVAVGVLAAVRRYSLAGLTLHAGLADRPGRPRPELGSFRDQVATTFADLATSLRTSTPPADLPPLRRTLSRESVSDVRALDAGTDMMVDSINSIAELLAANGVREPMDEGGRI